MDHRPLDYESPFDVRERRKEAAAQRRAARRKLPHSRFGIISCVVVALALLIALTGRGEQAIGFAWLLCLTTALPLSCTGLAQPHQRRDWAIAGLILSLAALGAPFILIRSFN
jgi:hypothetical protein